MSFFANRALAFSLLLSMAIATTEVSLWITIFALIFVAWRFAYEKWNVYKLSSKITPIFGVIVFVIVYMQYKSILGQEESTTVLLGLASLSILNYNSERDDLVLVLIGFLMVVIKSVFSLDFIWTVPALISFFGLWFSLIRNTRIDKIKYLLMTALKSVPVFAVLFVFFPRFVIFQSKQTQKVYAQSGFSEELNPWRASEMNLQNQMVFRADFKSSFMTSEELYWRGAVLNVSNGFSWQKGIVERVSSYTSENDNFGVINYRIILEPINLKNIFVLESPVGIRSASSPIFEMQSKNFVLSEVQTQQVQYEGMAAFNSSAPDDEDPVNLKRYLNVTTDLPAKTKSLVEEIKAKNLTPRGRIDALKKFFTGKGFVYTIKPGFYKDDLDEFLFMRKKGFCEHYAAAFATLVRALDIPSRVIVGYQGGLYNSLGNFWKISQKDAHTWVEVGVDNKWMRVDPTAWVSPLRLSLGGEIFFSLSEDEQILYSKDRSWRRPKSYQNYIEEIKAAFDNLNYYWTLLLLNYDLQAQLDYLKRLKSNAVAVGLIGFSILALLLIYGYNRRRPDPVYHHEMQALFSQIETWATQQGIEIEKQQTPLQILENIRKSFPVLSSVLSDVEQNYIKAAYQNQPTQIVVAHLSRTWKEVSRPISK